MTARDRTSDDERRRGPAEVARGGATSLAGRRTTVSGNKSRSGPGRPDEAMRQAPAASNARAASTASSAKNIRPRTREQPNGGRCSVEKARNGRGGSARRPESHAS